MIYRVNSQWIRPIKHTSNRRVQLQNCVSVECYKPRMEQQEMVVSGCVGSIFT